MIEQNYNLDTVPFQSAVPVVHVSQYDSGSRTLKFALNEGGSVIDMSNVTGAKINGRKPDNTAFSYDMAISSNVVSIVVTEQMTAVSGRVVAEVVLLGANDAVLGTGNFIIEVEKSPIDEGVISDTDIPILIDFMTGGTAGQIFQRTANGGEWVDPSAVTTKTQWGDIEGNIADQSDLNTALTELNDNLSSVSQAVSQKADAQAVDQALAQKANITDVDAALTLKADKTYVDTGLADQKYFYIDSEGYGCINYDLFQTA